MWMSMSVIAEESRVYISGEVLECNDLFATVALEYGEKITIPRKLLPKECAKGNRVQWHISTGENAGESFSGVVATDAKSFLNHILENDEKP